MSCMATSFVNLKIIKTDMRPQIKWAVSLVIAYGHFNHLPGRREEGGGVCMGLHTHFFSLDGRVAFGLCKI